MKLNSILLTFLTIAQTTFAQNVSEYCMGAELEDETYSKLPMQVTQLTRDYETLPASCSLKQYCPTPKSQGQYGTCTSWACGYAARTIAEAVANNWTDITMINKHAFSPPFIYKQIKDINDANCQNGSCISTGLELLKTRGVPYYSDFSPMCAEYIPTELYTSAIDHKISDYYKLFDYNEESQKVYKVKKALASKCPVVISIACYDSFSFAKSCWSGVKDNMRGHHAMCVVGYDDNKYGGAFQIMNSWGTNWGEGGFIWVKYSDFKDVARYAFQIYAPKTTPNPIPVPTPKPVEVKDKPTITWECSDASETAKFMVKAGIKAKKQITRTTLKLNGSIVKNASIISTPTRGINYVVNNGYQQVVTQEVMLKPGNNTIDLTIVSGTDTVRQTKTVTYTEVKENSLSGSFYVKLATGETMPVTLKQNTTIPTYKVNNSYISGTRYRVYISNNEPAYVYVLASDLSNSVSKVFPPADNISPALVYSSNNIALPDEKWYMEMDNTVGTDHLCVLYSKDALDINSIITKIKQGSGTFYQRLSSALAGSLVPMTDATLQSNTVNFSARTSHTVLPVVIEIEHK